MLEIFYPAKIEEKLKSQLTFPDAIKMGLFHSKYIIISIKVSCLVISKI